MNYDDINGIVNDYYDDQDFITTDDDLGVKVKFKNQVEEEEIAPVDPYANFDGEIDYESADMLDDEPKEPIVHQVVENKGKSKMQQARDLYNPNKSRKENLEVFQHQIGLTAAGAATYYATIKSGK